MKKSLLTTFCLSSALLFDGCWVTQQQGLQITADIDNIRLQNNQLKRAQEEYAARTSDKLKELTARTEALAIRLDSLDQSAHRGTADIGFEMETLKKELAMLRGEIEVSNNSIHQMGQRVNKVEEDAKNIAVQAPPPPPPLYIQDPPATSSNNGTTASTSGSSASSQDKKAEAKVEPAKKPSSAEELLAEADEKLKKKDIQGAVKIYNEVLKKNPKKIGLADVALFGLGKAAEASGKNSQAYSQYEKITVDLAKSPLVDDAIFRMAQISIKDGDKAMAKNLFEMLISFYPKSELAPEAKKQLEKLKTAKKGKK